MSVVDEQPVCSRNIVDSGGCGPEVALRRLLRSVRTSARALLNVAANPSDFFTLCLLATIASVAAQAVAAPVILINRNSGQCVSDNGSSKLGLQMIQRTCRGLLSEQWALSAVDDGYRIVSRLNGLCLAVAGASTADGAAVQQRTCNGSSEQTWTPQLEGSWFQLVSKLSGKCLAVSGASRDDGAVLIQSSCLDADNQRWTISASPLPSVWSPVIKFPIAPAAAANMADGRIVLWSAWKDSIWWRSPPNLYGDLRPSDRPAERDARQQYRSRHVLPGHQHARGRSNPGQWREQQQEDQHLRSENWNLVGIQLDENPARLQGDTLLSTGEVLTLGGSWSGGIGGKNAEVWASGLGWRLLPGIPIDPFIGPDPAGVYRGDNHLWLIAASDGWAFHAGPAAQMHWIDTKNGGAVIAAGPRGDDAFAINGNAVVYDTGKILKVGGAAAYSNGTATDSAYVIDIRGGPPAPAEVRKLAPMVFPRAFSNSVVLPSGQVVVVGGMNISKAFSDVRAPTRTVGSVGEASTD